MEEAKTKVIAGGVRPPTTFERLNLKPRLLRLAVAAQYLSVSPKTLRALIRAGEIRTLRVTPGAPMLVSTADLDKWVEINLCRYEDFLAEK